MNKDKQGYIIGSIIIAHMFLNPKNIKFSSNHSEGNFVIVRMSSAEERDQ